MSRLHIDRVLETAVRVRATDVFLVPQRSPVLRIDGALRSLETSALNADDVERCFEALAIDAARTQLSSTGHAQWALDHGAEDRFRVRATRHNAGLELVFRRHRRQPPSAEELGLPPIVKALCSRSRGLFLVTGPAGAGKTTVLASLIDYINAQGNGRRIVTIEPTTEFVHAHQRSLVIQHETGPHVIDMTAMLAQRVTGWGDALLMGDFAEASVWRAGLQHARLDTLVLAEMQDVAVQACLTRWIDRVPVHEQQAFRLDLAAALLAVLHCQLCPRYKGGGQVLVYEFLVTTPAVADLIRENKLYRLDAAMQTGGKFGMQLLDEHLYRLYQQGILAGETAIERARNPAALQARIAEEGGRTDRGEPPDADPLPVRPKRPPPDLDAQVELEPPSDDAGPA